MISDSWLKPLYTKSLKAQAKHINTKKITTICNIMILCQSTIDQNSNMIV